MAPILDLSHAHLVDGSQWKPTQKRCCSLISLKICIPASSSGVLRCIIAALETDVTQNLSTGPRTRQQKPSSGKEICNMALPKKSHLKSSQRQGCSARLWHDMAFQLSRVTESHQCWNSFCKSRLFTKWTWPARSQYLGDTQDFGWVDQH